MKMVGAMWDILEHLEKAERQIFHNIALHKYDLPTESLDDVFRPGCPKCEVLAALRIANREKDHKN